MNWFIIVILIIYIYNVKFNHPNYRIKQYKDIANKAKSGDIILFSSLDSFNQIFMGSYITHIGVVYRKDQDTAPILIEAFNNFRMEMYPREYKTGIATCDLETRLNSYRGYSMYKELDKPISQHANDDFLEFINYAKKNIIYDYNVIENEIGKILFNSPFTSKTNCGQLTALILIKIGLLDFSNFRSRQKHHLRYTAGLTKVKRNYYKEPVYIYQNYFNLRDV